MMKKYLYGLIISLVFSCVMSTSYGHGIDSGSGLISPPAIIPSSIAPSDATYITQTPDGNLSAEQALNALSDGLLKHASGVVAQAVAGTDYVNPLGISGGQTIIGGTDSGDDLTLQSTSNATKGSIFFGAAQNSAYDEVNDRLGIKTTTPITEFQVNGIQYIGAESTLQADLIGTFGSQLYIVGDRSVMAGFVNVATGNNTSGASIMFAKSRDTDGSADVIVQNGDQVGKFDGFGADGVSYKSLGAMRFYVDGVPGLDDMPGRVSFWTTPDGSTTLLERFRINSAGNMGLNTTAFGASAVGNLYLGSGTMGDALANAVGLGVEDVDGAGDAGLLIQPEAGGVFQFHNDIFSTSAGMRLLSGNGTVILGGVGGTNNEAISFDGETQIDRVIVDSPSGAIFQFVNDIIIQDGTTFRFGNASDVFMVWETEGNDNFQIAIEVGSAAASGYISFMEIGGRGNVNRSPLTVSDDPVLRGYSSDVTEALDYWETYHNQANAVYDWGNGALLLPGGDVGIGIPIISAVAPRSRLEILDITGLASESLQDGNFSSFTNWTEAGDMAEGTNNYVYTHSSASGSLTQASGDLTIAGIGDRWYKLQYTISNVTETGILAATLTTAFAGTAVDLEVDSGGTKTHYFTSKASPGDFVISVASNTASDTFTIDDITLKEVIGGGGIFNGDVDINGRLRLGQQTGSTTDGDIWNDSTQKAMQVFVSDIEQSLVGVIFTQTADQTIASSTTETTLFGAGVGTLTLPANFWTVGKTIRLEIHGDFADTGTPTAEVQAYFGAVSLVDSGAITLSGLSSTEGWQAEVTITCRTTGATGTLETHIDWEYETTTGSSAIERLDVAGTNTVVDTTASGALDVTFQWGTNSASNTLTSKIAFITVLN